MITRRDPPDHWVFVNLGGALGSGRVWIDPARATELASKIESIDDWPFAVPAPVAAERIRALAS